MIRQNKQTSTLTKLITWYCRHSPVNFGKSKLRKFGLTSLGVPKIETSSIDGVNFLLHMPEDASWFSIYYDGTFETGTLEVMKKILRKDDIVLDICANLGWYTTHIAEIIEKGHIHAFEPVPHIFQKLKRHCEINSLSANTTFNECALGDKEGTIELHTFPDLPHGHSSISTLGRTNYSTSYAPIVTLDSYIKKNRLEKIDLIKMDVEGAEALVLRGAEHLLNREDPPIWIIELNIETAASFGHKPGDLLRILNQNNNFEFYKVVRGWDEFVPMKSLDDYGNGDNAVCIPKTKTDRLSPL